MIVLINVKIYLNFEIHGISFCVVVGGAFNGEVVVVVGCVVLSVKSICWIEDNYDFKLFS